MTNRNDKKMTKYLIILVTCCFVHSIVSAKDSWDTGINYSYINPEIWKTISKTCGGNHQSPISLSRDGAIINPKYPSRLAIFNMMKLPATMALINSGHHVVLNVTYHGDPPTATGGPLGDDVYKVVVGLFHWGTSNHNGSEHAFDEKRYPMEFQILTYNSKYNDLISAIDKPDGIVIESKFVKHVRYPGNVNAALKALKPALAQIRKPGDVAEVKPFPLAYFVPPESLKKLKLQYFMYEGSLTEPPCLETARWFLNVDKIGASQDIIDAFRKIELFNNEKTNNRPLQEQNGRNITVLSSSLLWPLW